MRVLIIDDDRALRDALRRALTLAGYEIDAAASGEAGTGTARRGTTRRVVLDVGLRGMDGLEACRRLRAAGDRVPVLMLTARDAIDDRIDGLDAGADDYLVKPFDVGELKARLRALLRRNDADVPAGGLTFDGLRLDPARHGVVIGEEFAELTRTEYQLLELLMRNPRRVLTHDVIYDRVWGYDFGPASNALRVYIGYLRRKLEHAGAPSMIRHRPRRRLHARASRDAAPPHRRRRRPRGRRHCADRRGGHVLRRQHPASPAGRRRAPRTCSGDRRPKPIRTTTRPTSGPRRRAGEPPFPAPPSDRDDARFGGAEGYLQVVCADGTVLRPTGAAAGCRVAARTSRRPLWLGRATRQHKGRRHSFARAHQALGPGQGAVQVARPLTEVDRSLRNILIVLAVVSRGRHRPGRRSRRTCRPDGARTGRALHAPDRGDRRQPGPLERIAVTGDDELARLATELQRDARRARALGRGATPSRRGRQPRAAHADRQPAGEHPDDRGPRPAPGGRARGAARRHPRGARRAHRARRRRGRAGAGQQADRVLDDVRVDRIVSRWWSAPRARGGVDVTFRVDARADARAR